MFCNTGSFFSFEKENEISSLLTPLEKATIALPGKNLSDAHVSIHISSSVHPLDFEIWHFRMKF